jgi:hypothetical protein
MTSFAKIAAACVLLFACNALFACSFARAQQGQTCQTTCYEQCPSAGSRMACRQICTTQCR